MKTVEDVVREFEDGIWPNDGTFSLGSNAHMHKISDFLRTELTSLLQGLREREEGTKTDIDTIIGKQQ